MIPGDKSILALRISCLFGTILLVEEMGNAVISSGGPHKVMYLYVYFPVGGTAWEGLGGIDVLEDMCHCR